MGTKRKKNNRGRAKTVGFVSLGCAKNTVDSEKMLARILEAGYLLKETIEDADVVVINTCGFIAPAKSEAVEVITEMAGYKSAGRVKKIVVTGCLSQRMGQGLLDELGQIDAVVGLGQRDNIAEIITALFEGTAEKLYLGGDDWDQKVQDDSDRLLINPSHWAYLRISEGCDRRCSFCTIPMIKGRFRSKPLKQVLSEANQLADAGAVELSIIAQDSNYYGKDLGLKNGLVTLLCELEKIDRLKWIRLMYLYPAGIDEMLIETIAKSQKVVNYVDIPIQHINNQILKDMQRTDTKEKTVGLIENLRKAMPDVVLRTTVIAGFAGETDEQFNELLDFIKWARFDCLGCFAFCAEEGTKAAGLSRQVPDEVKQQRTEEIMLSQQQIAFEKNRSLIGSELVCLVDAKTGKTDAVGRFYGQAPHIDSVCVIKNCVQQPGEFVRCKVADTQDYDLIVEKIAK